MLRVVENFAVIQSHSRSFKVIRIYIVEWGVCKSLLVFHSNLIK